MSQKQKILHAALFTPTSKGWGLPLLLWGPPGVAKTATIEALGRIYNWHVEVLSPGERGEGAFGVTPVGIERNGQPALTYPAPDWVANFTNSNASKTPVGIAFFDEATTAPPAIQPALLGAVHEKRIGGAFLGKRVRCLGAANPPEQAAAGYDLSAPMSNRFGHIEWPSPEASDWADWLLGSQGDTATINADAEEERVMKAWPLAFAKASGLVAAFIRRRAPLLHKMPAVGDPAMSRAWPSPRTWELATRAIAAADVHGLNEEEADELSAAFVGIAAIAEFRTFIDAMDLPDPADLLDGKIKWEHNPRRLDITDVVASSCVALVCPVTAEKRKERAEAFWRLLAGVAKDAKDLAVPPAAALVKAKLNVGEDAKDVLADLYAVLEATKKAA